MIWPDWVEIGIRFINFAASILLAAIVGFYLLTRSCGWEAARSNLFPARLILGLEVLAWLAQAGWLFELLCLLSAETDSDQMGASLSLLSGTQFGKIGLLRCGVLFGLIAYRALWLFRHSRSRMHGSSQPPQTSDALYSSPRQKLAAIESVLIFGQLALLAGFSHAAAGVGAWGWVQLGNDLLHLIGAAIWPGGLVPLAFLLFRSTSEELKREALLKFSNVAVVVAPLMGVTGVLSAYFRMHHFAPLLTTMYGRYVLLKMLCFAVLVGFGAINRLKLIPSLGESSGNIQQPEQWKRLRRNILIEQALFVVVLLAVARLGLLEPPYPK